MYKVEDIVVGAAMATRNRIMSKLKRPHDTIVKVFFVSF